MRISPCKNGVKKDRGAVALFCLERVDDFKCCVSLTLYNITLNECSKKCIHIHRDNTIDIVVCIKWFLKCGAPFRRNPIQFSNIKIKVLT